MNYSSARELEAHLDTCSDCRAASIELDSLRRTLRAGAQRYTTPSQLRERIQATIADGAPKPMRHPRRQWLALAASWVLARLYRCSEYPARRAATR